MIAAKINACGYAQMCPQSKACKPLCSAARRAICKTTPFILSGMLFADGNKSARPLAHHSPIISIIIYVGRPANCNVTRFLRDADKRAL